MYVSIEVSSLGKTYAGTRGLDNVSDIFAAGNLHGVIGPDGAGKTTLMRLLAGLLRPTSGCIEFKEAEKTVDFETVRPSIAYMPSKPSLYPDLSVEEHLIFFRDLYDLSPRAYDEKKTTLLQITRLDKFKDRKIGELSGGMYKKVGLMCALLRSPSVLLLDEPTNGVDPISRREFWELLYGLLKEKILIILATAYMDEAERATRVHFFDAGKLIKAGEPKQILEEEKISSFNELFGAKK